MIFTCQAPEPGCEAVCRLRVVVDGEGVIVWRRRGNVGSIVLEDGKGGGVVEGDAISIGESSSSHVVETRGLVCL